MPTNGVLTERAIISAGGLAEFKRKGEHYNANALFVESCRKNLINKYDKKWIAVYNSSLVASSNKLPKLLRALRGKKIPLDESLIQYLSSNDTLTLY